MNEEYPRVSVIIAVLNDVKKFERSLDSTLNQTWQNLEVLVVDGGSTDGTENIMKSRSADLAFCCSEPDLGIYNAWNKALTHAKGDYICFIGADDVWVDNTCIEKLAGLAASNVDIVSAKSMVVLPDGQELVLGEPWNWESFSKDMSLSHRGMLHHVTLFERKGLFDENFKIAGDYEFLLRFGSELNAEFLDGPTIVAGAEGVSIAHPYLAYREKFRAKLQHKTESIIPSLFRFTKSYLYFKYWSLKNGL